VTSLILLLLLFYLLFIQSFLRLFILDDHLTFQLRLCLLLASVKLGGYEIWICKNFSIRTSAKWLRYFFRDCNCRPNLEILFEFDLVRILNTSKSSIYHQIRSSNNRLFRVFQSERTFVVRRRIIAQLLKPALSGSLWQQQQVLG